MDDGSGDDDVEDSKTEDISDGKDNSAAVPTTTSEQPQGIFWACRFHPWDFFLYSNRAGDKRGDRDSPSSITHCSHF